MENIAADEAECPLKIERRKDLARQDRPLEIRRMIIDRLDHQIGDGFTVVVPRRTVGQLRRDMLAKETRHVLSAWCEGVVDCRRNDQFNDRAARPAKSTRVELSLLHIGEARGDDNA